MSTGERDKALEAFTKALEFDPGSIVNRINMARVLSRSGEKERAAEYYRLAWEEDPGFPHLALEYGYLLDELGKRAEAKRLYKDAWKSGRRNEMITACKLLSRMAYTQGNVDEAITWIRRALEIAPGDEGLLKLLHGLEGP
jgi:tetratricopeptide (TPR) repeat protein